MENSMKKSRVAAVAVATGLFIAPPLLADHDYDQPGHTHGQKQGQAEPDCAAMQTMDHSKMDMNDPDMLAMMKKCMPAMRGGAGHGNKQQGHKHGGESGMKHDHE